RVIETGWPEGIDLPTASGKTACIDVAVFLLALGEHDGRLESEHPARRRVFFVVDRRIVVDEAYDRARKLAEKLGEAQDGVLKQVADRLRALAGGDTPLIVSRLRGGTVKDERWRLSPAQPCVVTGTVDQLGSRLLFRSYGCGPQSAPIEAALTACDSLILLDEAHCAVPFMQTARAVARYSGKPWCEGEPIVSPLRFTILSATLPKDVTNIFPSTEEREVALGHPLLERRNNAGKPAELVETKDARDDDSQLINKVVELTTKAVSNGHRRITVMVNRVARASKIAECLRTVKAGDKPKLDADVELMTGRMRPIDRDRLVEQWSPVLKAGSQKQPERPIVLVTTQCLEVGADFSFDALITECASLDALRQRFGRLNRLGDMDQTYAVVLIRKADVKPDDKLDDAKPLDPIYGNAMARTWNWLKEPGNNGTSVDFGIAAMDGSLPDDPEELGRLLAPSPDAPVLLPAYVDLLCQTAPRPVPDPDVALFLHGPQRGTADVQIVFRADL
ncbi:MAG TPA: type I-U CRISPR-associated helicase/endonuclease Cas3, partial [Gammaproteobacteria bacterium]|nr:type I-U CRISPR-associated helicase/endonuclease Cas3 [Gammaproteobacteria bacterium]